MLFPDPAEMSGVEWQISDTAQRLARLIANAAVENPTEIPDDLIRAYHDALQLHAYVASLNKKATAVAMAEVSK